MIACQIDWVEERQHIINEDVSSDGKRKIVNKFAKWKIEIFAGNKGFRTMKKH